MKSLTRILVLLAFAVMPALLSCCANDGSADWWHNNDTMNKDGANGPNKGASNTPDSSTGMTGTGAR